MKQKEEQKAENMYTLLSILDQQFAPQMTYHRIKSIRGKEEKTNTILKHPTEILLSFVDQAWTHVKSLSLA